MKLKKMIMIKKMYLKSIRFLKEILSWPEYLTRPQQWHCFDVKKLCIFRRFGKYQKLFLACDSTPCIQSHNDINACFDTFRVDRLKFPCVTSLVVHDTVRIRMNLTFRMSTFKRVNASSQHRLAQTKKKNGIKRFLFSGMQNEIYYYQLSRVHPKLGLKLLNFFASSHWFYINHIIFELTTKHFTNYYY